MSATQKEAVEETTTVEITATLRGKEVTVTIPATLEDMSLDAYDSFCDKPVAVYRDILSPEDWNKIKATGATLRDFQKHVVPLIDKEWGLTGK